MVNMRDIAEKAGVSLATVSHVINETRYVSEPIRKRVFQAMEEVGYSPNDLARALRRGETRTIGLILPDSSNPFFAEVGRAIEGLAFDRGYSVILCNTEGNLDHEYFYVDTLAKKRVDGVIFVATGDSPKSLHFMEANHMPVVLIDRELKDFDGYVVVSDNHKGGHQATQYLIDLGHRQIACITGPSNLTPTYLRELGYRDALLYNNIQSDEKLLYKGDFHPDSGFQAMQYFLSLPNPPTAIFASNDLEAIGVLRFAAKNGINIPNALSVVGFDNIELSSYITPSLTTIDQPKHEIAKTAMELMLDAIGGKKASPHRICLEPQLIIRESTGVYK